MARRQEPACRVGEDHRSHEPLRKPAHGLAGTRLKRAATGPDERPPSPLEQLGSAVELSMRLRPAAPNPQGGLTPLRVCLGAQQVRRDLHVDRSRGRLQGGAGRACNRGADLVGRVHPDRLLHDRHEHGRLVGGLVQHASPDARAARRRGDVGGDHQDRLARRPRLAHRGERVGRARPGGRQRDPQAPAGACVTVGGVGGRLLVSHAHEPDRRAVQLAPQRQVVHSGEPKGDLDPGVLERRHRGARPCQDAARWRAHQAVPPAGRRRSARRRARGRPLARARRALLHDGARRPRRRRDQGRAPGGRRRDPLLGPALRGRGGGVLPVGQPRQAQLRARPVPTGGPCARPRALRGERMW